MKAITYEEALSSAVNQILMDDAVCGYFKQELLEAIDILPDDMAPFGDSFVEEALDTLDTTGEIGLVEWAEAQRADALQDRASLESDND